MKIVVLQALEEVGKWTKLFIGDRNSDDPDLYTEIADRMDKVGATYNADKSIKTIQTTLSLPDYEDVSNDKDIDSNMERISWKVDLTSKGLVISLYVLLPEEYEDDNGDIQLRDELHEVKTTGMDPLEDIRKYFYELSSLQFLSFPKQHYVIDELRTNSKYSNPDELSKIANDYSNVLFAGRPALDLSKIQKAFYIRCQNDHNSDATRYADQVQKWLENHVEEMKGQSQGIQLLSSEDPFVCEFIRSYSNVDSTSFLRWHELKEAYLRHIQQMKDREEASRLHIFPAEYHASKYEQMITPLLHKPYRAFHPRVVTMLENPDRLSLFFRCVAYGFFDTLEGAQYDGFSFALPELDPYVLIPQDQDGRSSEPNYFEKVYSFVLYGKDAITGLYIDWKQVITTVRKYEKQLQETSELEKALEEKLENGLFAAIDEKGNEIMKNDRANNPGAYATEKTWGWHPGQEFTDLADIGRLMVKEVIRNSKTSKFI